MILDREHRPVSERYATVRPIEQGDVGFLHTRRQTFAIDCKPVVHRSDLDFPRGQFLDRVIGAMVALVHLVSSAADRDPEHLVSETDTEGWHTASDDFANYRHSVGAGRGWITGAIGKEHSAWLELQNLTGRCLRRDRRHFRAR